MEFKKSKYYNKEFLGNFLYLNIFNSNKILTVQEYFGINDVEKEYSKEGKNIDKEYFNYKIIIHDNYYELKCSDYDSYLYLVFDKPVHITGEYCTGIIAPEIIIEEDKNESLSHCLASKVVINNNFKFNYGISFSRIKDVYFYNSKVGFRDSEINNFFIFDENLSINAVRFLNGHKIKCFGRCKNLKEEISKVRDFDNGIIHFE